MEQSFLLAGLRISVVTYAEVLARVRSWVENDRKRYVCVVGLHGVREALRTKQVREALHASALLVPDGMPLVWCGRALGYENTHRIYGPDLFLNVCGEAERKQWSVFLYGTTEDALAKLTLVLRKKFPRLVIAGTLAPPFRNLTDSEDEAEVHTMNTSGARVVFVGLSTPMQEVWMHKHNGKLSANVLIGVGAAFDFISGTKKQAPLWMRRTGLEWLFRLVSEPRRLWRRYAEAAGVFFSLVFPVLVRAIIKR